MGSGERTNIRPRIYSNMGWAFLWAVNEILKWLALLTGSQKRSLNL